MGAELFPLALWWLLTCADAECVQKVRHGPFITAGMCRRELVLWGGWNSGCYVEV